MAYDTTLHDRMQPAAAPRHSLREGYIADWGSRYFPRTTVAGLSAVLALAAVVLLAGFAPLGTGPLWHELAAGRQGSGLVNRTLYSVYALGGWDGLVALRTLSLTALLGASIWAASRRGGLMAATVVASVGMLPVLALGGDPRPALLLAPLWPLALIMAQRLSRERGWLFWCSLAPLAIAYPLASRWLAHGLLVLNPLEPASLSGLLFFASWAPAIVVLRKSPRAVTVREGVLLALAASAALWQREALFIWTAVAPWVLAPHAAAAWRVYPAHRPESARATAHSTRTLIAMAAVFAAILLNPATAHLVLGTPRAEGRVVADAGPLEVADEIERRGLTGVCFAPPAWSDYLTWHSGGRIAPLGAPADELSHLAAAGAYWLQIADRRGVEYLVVPRKTWPALTRLTSESPRADILYQDELCQLVQILPAAETPSP